MSGPGSAPPAGGAADGAKGAVKSPPSAWGGGRTPASVAAAASPPVPPGADTGTPPGRRSRAPKPKQNKPRGPPPHDAGGAGGAFVPGSAPVQPKPSHGHFPDASLAPNRTHSAPPVEHGDLMHTRNTHVAWQQQGHTLARIAPGSATGGAQQATQPAQVAAGAGKPQPVAAAAGQGQGQSGPTQPSQARPSGGPQVQSIPPAKGQPPRSLRAGGRGPPPADVKGGAPQHSQSVSPQMHQQQVPPQFQAGSSPQQQLPQPPQHQQGSMRAVGQGQPQPRGNPNQQVVQAQQTQAAFQQLAAQQHQQQQHYQQQMQMQQMRQLQQHHQQHQHFVQMPQQLLYRQAAPMYSPYMTQQQQQQPQPGRNMGQGPGAQVMPGIQQQQRGMAGQQGPLGMPAPRGVPPPGQQHVVPQPQPKKILAIVDPRTGKDVTAGMRDKSGKAAQISKSAEDGAADGATSKAKDGPAISAAISSSPNAGAGPAAPTADVPAGAGTTKTPTVQSAPKTNGSNEFYDKVAAKVASEQKPAAPAATAVAAKVTASAKPAAATEVAEVTTPSKLTIAASNPAHAPEEASVGLSFGSFDGPDEAGPSPRNVAQAPTNSKAPVKVKASSPHATVSESAAKAKIADSSKAVPPLVAPSAAPAKNNGSPSAAKAVVDEKAAAEAEAKKAAEAAAEAERAKREAEKEAKRKADIERKAAEEARAEEEANLAAAAKLKREQEERNAEAAAKRAEEAAKAEAKAKADAEAKAKADAEAKARADAEAKARDEAERMEKVATAEAEAAKVKELAERSEAEKKSVAAPAPKEEPVLATSEAPTPKTAAPPPEDSWETLGESTAPANASPSPSSKVGASGVGGLRPAGALGVTGLRPGGGGLGSGGLSGGGGGGLRTLVPEVRPAVLGPSPSAPPAIPDGSVKIGSVVGGKRVYTAEELKIYSGIADRPAQLTVTFDIIETRSGAGSGARPAGSSGGGSFRPGGSMNLPRGGQGGGGGSFGDRRPSGRGDGGRMAGGGGGGDEWKRGRSLPVNEQNKGGGGRGGRGGGGGGGSFRAEPDAPMDLLRQAENRWVPTKDNSPLVVMRKQVQGILNKMTKEKFDRLSQQLLDIKIESLDMLSILVEIVFDKAVEEHHFSDMYADLCVRLHNQSSTWTFVKAIYNEDANQWNWTPDVGVDPEVVGPYDSVEELYTAVVNEDIEVEPKPRPYDMDVVEFKIKDQKLIKVMQGREPEQAGKFYAVFMPEDKGRQHYIVSPDAFGSEDDALQQAGKKTALRTQLLNRCQMEFEKDDIYQDLVKEQEAFKRSEASMDKEEFRLKEAEFAEKRIKMKRRMLGNMQFIGELYKKDMLKENIIHACCLKLLNAEDDEKSNFGFKFKNNKTDEEDLEALVKLLTTIGKSLASARHGQRRVPEYFKLLERLSKDSKRLSSRIRFSIKDLIEMKNNNWEPRRKVEKSKTLDELRKSSAPEEKSRTSMNPRGGGGGVAPAGRRDWERGGGRPTSAGGGSQDVRGPLSSRTGAAPSPLGRQGSGDVRRSGAVDSPASARPGLRLREAPREADRPAAPSPKSVGSSSASQGPSEADLELVKRKVNGIIGEYMSLKDDKEAAECLDEIPNKQLAAAKMVEIVTEKCMEAKDADRPLFIALMDGLIKRKLIDSQAALVGIMPHLEVFQDLLSDLPKGCVGMSQLLALFFSECQLSFPEVADACAGESCPPPTRGKLFGNCFRNMIDTHGGTGARDLLAKCKFYLPLLFKEKAEGMSFLREYNLWILEPSLAILERVPTPASLGTPCPRPTTYVAIAVDAEPLEDLRLSHQWVDGVSQLVLEAAEVTRDIEPSGDMSSDVIEALRTLTAGGGIPQQTGCLWGVYYFNHKNKQADPRITVRLFSHLKESGVIGDEALSSWSIEAHKVTHSDTSLQNVLHALDAYLHP